MNNYTSYCYTKDDLRDNIETIIRDANSGNSWAQAYMGDCYLFGYGVVQSAVNALEWYERSAEQNNPIGQVLLGVAYESLSSTNDDEDYIKQACDLYRKSAEQDHPLGQANLGRCHMYGLGVTRSVPEAIELFKRSSDKGHPTGQAFLGISYFYGEGVPKSIVKGVELCLKSYNQSDSARDLIDNQLDLTMIDDSHTLMSLLDLFICYNHDYQYDKVFEQYLDARKTKKRTIHEPDQQEKQNQSKICCII
jgi:TPR repeat protein